MGDSKKMLQVRSARQVPVRVIMLDDELFNDSVDVSIFEFCHGTFVLFSQCGSEFHTWVTCKIPPLF